MIMKTKKQILLWMAILFRVALPTSAMGLSEIRMNARFLTDRMAYELNLTTKQYNDLYEVNYDFLRNVNPYLPGVVSQDEVALDYYHKYLDDRNDDIRWILSNAEYRCFLSLDYFYSPVYTLNNLCYLRVFSRYPNRDHFYYRQPLHYMDYNGEHNRNRWRGESYYKRNFVEHCQHPAYRNTPHRSLSDYRSRNGNTRHWDRGAQNLPQPQNRNNFDSGRPKEQSVRRERNLDGKTKSHSLRPKFGNNNSWRPVHSDSRFIREK